MPTLNLTYSDANKCYVKSLGHWFNEKGERVPRYFRFAYGDTKEGRTKAEAELLPLLAQWQAIKASAKEKGAVAVWHNPKLATTKNPTVFELAKVVADREADGDGGGDEKTPSPYIAARQHQREQAVAVFQALRSNGDANPNKPLDDATIATAKEAYLNYYETSGVKAYSFKSRKRLINTILSGIDLEQPMITFDAPTVIEGIISKIVAKQLRARTAMTYAKGFKHFIEWYASKTEYRIPKNWKELFKGKRFKNIGNDNVIFDNDGAEADFLIYSTADLKVIVDTASTNRQKLYVLLALNAATYYVDIAHAIRSKNIHLDEKKPFLLYRREKESHREGAIIQKVWLWEETAKLLRKEMTKKSNIALLSDNGTPLTVFGVHSTWKRLHKVLVKGKELKHRIDPRNGKANHIRFTDLRKTGGSVISNLSSVDLGELHLGHKIAGVGNRYIKLNKQRLYSPIMKWRKELLKGGVFDSIK